MVVCVFEARHIQCKAHSVFYSTFSARVGSGSFQLCFHWYMVARTLYVVRTVVYVYMMLVCAMNGHMCSDYSVMGE